MSYLSSILDHPHVLDMLSSGIFKPILVALSVGHPRLANLLFEGQVDQVKDLVAVAPLSSRNADRHAQLS